MRIVLALVVALLCVPASAADYSPWPGQQMAQNRGGPATQECVPCGGGCPLQTGVMMCCCPMGKTPTCTPGTSTKLPNGNTECTSSSGGGC